MYTFQDGNPVFFNLIERAYLVITASVVVVAAPATAITFGVPNKPQRWRDAPGRISATTDDTWETASDTIKTREVEHDRGGDEELTVGDKLLVGDEAVTLFKLLLAVKLELGRYRDFAAKSEFAVEATASANVDDPSIV